jgi:ABC-2 type transport system permease protein
VDEEIMNDLGAVFVLWKRDLLRYWYDKARMITSLGQPILYLFVFGTALSPSFKGEAGVNFQTFIFPGIIAMVVLFSSVFSAMSIVWDREFGFLKEVLVAPISRTSIVIGKALGGSTVAMIQATLMLVLAPLIGAKLSIPVIMASLGIMFLLAFAITSLGIVIAARMKEMEGFQMIMNFLIMPLFFLSGALFPLDKLPAWLKVLTSIDPLTYGVDALRAVMIKANVYPIWYDLTIISAFALVMISLAVWEFNLKD